MADRLADLEEERVEAIILAGGEGKRLRPLTTDKPKPMVEVCGRPILWHQIRLLATHGVTRVILAVSYRWEVIHDFFKEAITFDLDGKPVTVEISYSVEEKLLGRGGAIKKAAKLLQGKDLVIVTNGDNIFDLNLASVLMAHQKSGTLLAIVVVPLPSPYGVVELEGDKVKAFKEKIRLPHWINAGIYVISPEAFIFFPEEGDHEDTTFPQLAQKGLLGAFRHEGLWLPIDTIKDLERAEKLLCPPAP